MVNVVREVIFYYVIYDDGDDDGEYESLFVGVFDYDND